MDVRDSSQSQVQAQLVLGFYSGLTVHSWRHPHSLIPLWLYVDSYKISFFCTFNFLDSYTILRISLSSINLEPISETCSDGISPSENSSLSRAFKAQKCLLPLFMISRL